MSLPSTKLIKELEDICLVDRNKYGYELIFDDGKNEIVRSASEARQAASDRRNQKMRLENESSKNMVA